MGAPGEICIHASCVAAAGRALLIKGASGSGKSALALQLMALGARLVADDRVLLRVTGGVLQARCPGSIRGLIEARGLGLLRAEPLEMAPVCAAVDMDAVETMRLPHQITETILGLDVPVLRRLDAPHFAPALMQYLKCGALDADTET